ncbi:hypothetical protein DM02DRAFT_666179 [Periconia macrospinosa]|uniref:Uncharacterized protein n=1 Tax=Periconia macrospinosa TaxID=97972 RepID=A0A2V1EFZ3_9PLEO|nr:hypothetical protein DM02DRAFT_666179 [Periconia macrospinosa]
MSVLSKSRQTYCVLLRKHAGVGLANLKVRLHSDSTVFVKINCLVSQHCVDAAAADATITSPFTCLRIRMLSSFKHRSLYSQSRILCTPKRSFNTRPKPLPLHVETWDPTRHKSLPPPTSPSDKELRLRDERRRERKRLCDGTYSKFVDSRQISSMENLNIVQYFIKRLQMRASQRGSKERLWRAYKRAKEGNADLRLALTNRAWDLLSISQDTEERRIEVFEDMIEATRLEAAKPEAAQLAAESRVAVLEQMVLQGEQADALREWEHDRSEDQYLLRIDHTPDHLELGVKLYALAGNANQARETMEELFELYPEREKNLPIMMHLFRVLADTDSEEHHEEAWNIYQMMRESIKDQPTLEQYDAWFIGFLEAKHDHYARLVLRDMIEAKALDVCYSEEEVVAETLRRLHLLNRLATDILKSTDISLLMLRTLPSSYHSHIYMHWMMAAIKFHAPNQISRILESMIRRGFQPQTVHLNLYMRALFRTRENLFLMKAEDLGWKMIEEARKEQRKNQVKRTVAGLIVDDLSKKQGEQSDATDSDPPKMLASADASTFAMIMDHCADNDRWEHVDYLAKRLDRSDIEPDADLMNVLIYNCTRKGQYAKAWSTYGALTTVPDGERGVFPTGTSIRYLWRNLYLALAIHNAEEMETEPTPRYRSAGLPTPRHLLAETIDWWNLCKSRPDGGQFLMGFATEFQTAIVKLILVCFSYAQDFAGSLVALHVMGKHFGIYPTADTVRVIQRHAAWVTVDEAREASFRQRLHDKKLAFFEDMYKTIALEKWQQMGYTDNTDERIAELDTDTVGKVELNTLSTFIRSHMTRVNWPQTIEGLIDEAKIDVGVPLMETEDVPLMEAEDVSLMEAEDVSLMETEDVPLMETGDVPLMEAEDVPLMEAEDVSAHGN